MEFNHDAVKRVIEDKKPAIYYLNDQKDENFKIFEEAALKMKDKFIFIHSKVSEDFGQKLAEFLGVNSKDCP